MADRKRTNRPAFGRATSRGAKRTAGATTVSKTPLNVRTDGVPISESLRDEARARMGAKLGKYAERIERLTVRFEDENGPRGGVDTLCRVKVVLSGLDSVVFEARAREAGEAMRLAAAGVERAVKRTLGRIGGGRRSTTRVGARKRPGLSASRERRASVPRGGHAPEAGSLIGRRVGRSQANLEAALDRPEKRRRDEPIDTSLPGVSATDRRAGGRSTARRNTKRNIARATSTLEDSMKDRPSRKSTRKSANRAKRDSNLRRRKVRSVSSPKARATRSAARTR